MLPHINSIRRGTANSHRRSLSILHRVVGPARVGKRVFVSETSVYNRTGYRSLTALGRAITTPGTIYHDLLIRGVVARGFDIINSLPS
jgi:hypothetical protein